MFQKETDLATIVVCEDDEATLELLCDHLVADRFDVLPAPAGADALRLCRYNRPDLMVIDLDLADRSGPEVIRAVRESDGIETRFDPHLPIIALTSRGGSTNRAVPADVGADDYVQKPFAYDELLGRDAYFFQDEVLALPQLAVAVDRSVDSFRTLLSQEAWDRIPRPDGKAGGSWYWLRSNVEANKWKARRRRRDSKA